MWHKPFKNLIIVNFLSSTTLSLIRQCSSSCGNPLYFYALELNSRISRIIYNNIQEQIFFSWLFLSHPKSLRVSLNSFFYLKQFDPQHNSIVNKFNNNKFYLHFLIVMAIIQIQLCFFLLLQMCFKIVFALKTQNLHFNSNHHENHPSYLLSYGWNNHMV